MTPLCECQKSLKIMILLILVISVFFKIIFVFIKLPKAGSLCVKVTPLLVIFDVYLIRYMVISTAQLHSTKS